MRIIGRADSPKEQEIKYIQIIKKLEFPLKYVF
jgi:hypothetical protein